MISPFYTTGLFPCTTYTTNRFFRALISCILNSTSLYRSQKFAGSIPDGVIGIFHGHNPSGPTMALGLTQPLAEMSTRNISSGVKAADA
jgi:hypothetical protein